MARPIDARAYALTIHSAPTAVTRIFWAMVAAVAMVAAMLLAPPSASAATVSESEPNDSIATADLVTLGTTIAGTTHRQTAVHSSDPDYFAFDVPQAGRLHLNFSFPAVLSTSEVYFLRVYGSDGGMLYAFDIRGTDTGGAALKNMSAFVPAGRTYVEVRAWEDGVAGGKSYSLRPTVTAGYVETESNDTIAASDALTVGRTIQASGLSPKIYTNTADLDYFAVSVPRSGRTTIDLQFPAGLGTGHAYNVTILNSSGTRVQSVDLTGSDSSGTRLRRTPVTLPRGTAYLVVKTYPSSVAHGRTYTLKVAQVERLAGADRYATSVAVSRASFGIGVPVAYVASGAGFADALSGAPVAGRQKGPVLLTAASSIPSVVAAELRRLKPQRIVVLGGTGVISESVRSALGAYTSGKVTRAAGADRYATSAAISRSAFAAGVPVAYIATGADFPDALAGAPAGTVKNGPVLLTASGRLPGSIATELKRLKPKRIIVIGTTGSVSTTVANALKSYTTGPVTRIAGGDRYATPAAVSANTFAAGAPVAYIASGTQYPDALSGVPVAGMQRGPVLMVTATSIPASVARELARLKPKRIVVLGGTGAVSDAVLGELGRYIVR